ncbi:hypothetical protein ACFLQ1_01420 [Candidatus Auribacterota bacterium]
MVLLASQILMSKKWMGISLMPQAGIAMGMAPVAVQRFPDRAKIIFPVIIASTILFKILGLILTRRAIIKVGEAHPDR